MAEAREGRLQCAVVPLGLTGECAPAAPSSDEVDDAVDGSARGVDACDEVGDRGFVGEVAHLGRDRAPGCGADVVDERGQACRIPPDGDHLGARGGELTRAGEARGARGAGDHDAAPADGASCRFGLSGLAHAGVRPVIPVVEAMTGRIFFSRASKNIDRGNSSGRTASV